MDFENQVNRLHTDTATGDLYITFFNGKVNGQHKPIVKWDGGTATLMQAPFDLGIRLNSHKGKLVASGYGAGPPALYKIATYNGSVWITVDSASSTSGSEVAPIGIVDSNLVVTGLFDSVAGHPIKYGAIWDGSNTWRDFYRIDTLLDSSPTPAIDFALKYKGEVYVGGIIYGPNNMTHIAKFNGTKWTNVG